MEKKVLIINFLIIGNLIEVLIIDKKNDIVIIVDIIDVLIIDSIIRICDHQNIDILIN